jgi:hypothetical protein
MKLIKINFFRLLFILGVIGFSSCGSKTSCNVYKIGKFELVDSIYGLKYIIERDNEVQVETNFQTNEVSKFSVDWISDCSYTLKPIEGSSEMLNYYRDKKLNIEILEVYEDSYKFTARMDGEKVSYEQIMKVSNEKSISR